MNRGADPEHCITCSDSAVPMCVEVLLGDSGLAVCDGQIVDVTLVLPVRPGDVVLVHADTALARLEPEEVA
jgi:HupF/HypC family